MRAHLALAGYQLGAVNGQAPFEVFRRHDSRSFPDLPAVATFVREELPRSFTAYPSPDMRALDPTRQEQKHG